MLQNKKQQNVALFVDKLAFTESTENKQQKEINAFTQNCNFLCHSLYVLGGNATCLQVNVTSIHYKLI